jgi:hypothetical protein
VRCDAVFTARWLEDCYWWKRQNAFRGVVAARHSTRNPAHAHLSQIELGPYSRLTILQDFKAAKYGHHEYNSRHPHKQTVRPTRTNVHLGRGRYLLRHRTIHEFIFCDILFQFLDCDVNDVRSWRSNFWASAKQNFWSNLLSFNTVNTAKTTDRPTKNPKIPRTGGACVRRTNSLRPFSNKHVQNTCYCRTIPGNTIKLKDFVLSEVLRLIAVRIAATNGSMSISVGAKGWGYCRLTPGVGVSGAGGRAYWLWWTGEGWVFVYLELYCDNVNCTYVGGERY